MSDKNIGKALNPKCKPYPYNAAQIAWLHDLETTTEPQTEGYLHRVDPICGQTVGFCCLGRASVVLGVNGEQDGYTVFYGGDDQMLSGLSVGALRLRGPHGDFAENFEPSVANCYTSLADLNDDAWSFKEIAAYIRANPWNVFLSPEEEK